ncbi:MAG TPA: chemotaxis protein CheW [Stellaceae bacterium]
MCRVGTRRCAIPLAFVTETMRAAGLMPIRDAEGFAVGAAIIRGEAVPVLDTGALLGEPQTDPRRLVAVSVGERRVAILVDDVVGVSAIAEDIASTLPPLLRGAIDRIVGAIDVRDGDFLLRLEASRLIPDGTLDAIGDLGEVE